MLKKITGIKILLLAIAIIGLFFIFGEQFNPENDKNEQAQDSTTDSSVSVNDSNTKKNKARIAILIADLGLRNKIFKQVLELNANFAMGLTPYSDNFTKITEESLNSGHDTLMLIPTQSVNSSHDDPGPYALLTTSASRVNTQKFNDMINKIVSKDVGLYLSPSTVFTMQQTQTMDIIKLLEKNVDRFKFFAYYSGGKAAMFTRLLEESSVIKDKVIVIEKEIDSILSVNAIVTNLTRLMEYSIIRNSVMVGMITDTPLTINTVNKWITEKQNSGEVELVPFSQVIAEHNNLKSR